MAGLKVYDGSIWRATGVEDSYWDVLSAVGTPIEVNLSWPATGGSPVSYELSVDGVVSDVGNVTSIIKTGLTIGVSYEFKVRPVFADGSSGGWSFPKSSSPSGFNAATGGTETTVSDYNGSGHTYKIHTFTSSGSLAISSSTTIFRVLVVGGGGGGGGDAGGGGGAGRLVHHDTATIGEGTYTVTVGAAGGDRGSGNESSIATIYRANGGGRGGTYNGQAGASGGSGGGGGGTGGGGGANTSVPTAGTSLGTNGIQAGSAGGSGGGAVGTGVGGGYTSNINGTSSSYASGGQTNYGRAITPGSGGGGGPQYPNASGQAGQNGTVIVAYRIE